MKRPDYREGVILSARRRALLDELRAAGGPVLLCAPPGYGKSTFARLLRENGCAVAVREERRLRPVLPGAHTAVAGPDELGFDDDELRLAFASERLPDVQMDRVRELAAGWPVAALYLRRLSRLGALQAAVRDPEGAPFDDLFDYIEANVYAPARRSERLALLGGDTDFARHPFVRAAMQARHGEEVRIVQSHRATAAERQGDALGAEAGATATRNSFWLAQAYLLSGNIEAARAALPQADPDELARLQGALETGQQRRAADTVKPDHLKIELFAGRALLGERELRLSQREAGVLFTLAASPRHRADPAALLDAIWPELDAEQGHAALKVAVTRLRARLGNPRFVRFADGKYVLHDNAGVDLSELTNALEEYDLGGGEENLARFEALLGTSRPPRLRDAAWFAAIETLLVRRLHRLARELVANAHRRGNAAAVRRIGMSLLTADACDEEGCAALVRAHLLQGQTEAARAEYDRFAAHVRRELGCEPSRTFEAMAAEARG